MSVWNRLASPPAAGAPRRPGRKQQRIIETLRGEIVAGTVAGGARMPSHAEIARRFGVSLLTAQWALRHLQQAGFIRTRARRGTYVADRPPHLDTYGLVFWNDPSAASAVRDWSRFYTALTNEARRIEQAEGRRILLFHGIDLHTATEDRQRLLDQIAAQQLGGLIFANAPWHLTGTPILDQPGLPRVSLMGGRGLGRMPTVAFDGEQWLAKALDYLRGQKRKRIALVMHGVHYPDAVIDRLTAAQGLTIPPYWRQSIIGVYPPSIRSCIRLLMYGARDHRPDGLIIADDNFVEDAQAALVAAGVRVPAEVAVVGHCNFPWPPASVLPIKRLGFDIGEALRCALELIDRLRQGGRVPAGRVLPALFEEELGAPAVANVPAEWAEFAEASA